LGVRPTPPDTPSLSAPCLPLRHAHSSSKISPRRTHSSSRNLVDAGGVDESDVFSGAGVDNDDLRALINADLPGGDIDLGVWKLLAATAPSFAGVPTLLGYLVQAAK
jgi:hypothetical protein